jgi:hypothetical protein
VRQPLIFYLLSLQQLYKKIVPMIKKRTILRVIYVLIAVMAIATVIAYFVLVKDREWLAFYVVCCGGLMIVNLIILIFFVRKNLRK